MVSYGIPSPWSVAGQGQAIDHRNALLAPNTGRWAGRSFKAQLFDEPTSGGLAAPNRWGRRLSLGFAANS